MPIMSVSHTSYNKKRFDFGVPLEDISSTNDIHPRLKHLFHQAYKHYILNDTDIEHTLKNSGSLEVRFNLKEKLIFQEHCNISDNEPPGSYFWVIRHFLGLLPIPLLPKYCQNFTYDWESLGKKCQMVLSHNEYYDVNLNNKVDNCIARCIDTLPTEHFLLLRTLVNFIRKIAFRFGVLHKHNFVCLAKYYFGSVFIRPYRPGYYNNRKIFPLFIYLLTKWHNVTKECNRHVTIPEFMRDCITSSYLKKNAHCQTEFNDENYNYLFENSIHDVLPSYTCCEISNACCQTDLSNVPKKSSGINKSCQTERTVTSTTCCQTDLNLEDLGIIAPIANSSVIDKHCSDKYYTALFNDTSLGDNSISSKTEKDGVPAERGSKVDFSYIPDSNVKIGWNDVLRETEKTVKKIEEYIYDDYETFKWEDYNQISMEKRSMSTFKDNFKQPVWTEYSPRSLIYGDSNNENESSISALISDKTYFKFTDVCDDFTDCSNSEQYNARDTARENRSVHISKSCDHVNEILHSPKKKSEEVRREKSKINFGLKRFKMSFDFLRGLIPKRNYRPSYGNKTSKVRYKKIYNKAFTL